MSSRAFHAFVVSGLSPAALAAQPHTSATVFQRLRLLAEAASASLLAATRGAGACAVAA
jgi:hypothetical protein